MSPSSVPIRLSAITFKGRLYLLDAPESETKTAFQQKMASDTETTAADELKTTTAAVDWPRCVECGGWGLGLITNSQKICPHCAR